MLHQYYTPNPPSTKIGNEYSSHRQFTSAYTLWEARTTNRRLWWFALAFTYLFDEGLETLRPEIYVNRGFGKLIVVASGSQVVVKTRSLVHMEASSLVPDVIPLAPEGVLKVVYGEGDHEVNFGNELTPTQVKEEPTIVEWEADENAYYLLCMTDPDAPSRAEPAWREWHHWLVGNIPGTDIGMGETLSAYVGSAPPPGTGLHRYTFLVYRQPDKLEFDEKRLTNQSAENRECFSISKFAEKYNLGDPVAGNFFVAQFDDWCAEVYKRFGVSF